MQIVLTPEIVDSLKIDTTTLISNNNTLCIKIIIFDEHAFFAIIPLIAEQLEDFYQLRILFGDGTSVCFAVSFSGIVENDRGPKLVCYKICFEPDTVFYKRLAVFFCAVNFAQKRKEQRYSILDPSFQNHITKTNKILHDGIWHDCLINDISFSGACVFVAGQWNIFPAQKIAFQLGFTNPKKILVLLAAVLRVKSVDSNITEIAFKFVEPVDILFVERLYELVRKFS